MTNQRDEYGHYIVQKNVIHLSQDVQRAPATRGGHILPPDYVYSERIENDFLLYELAHKMAEKTPEDIQGGFYV